MNETSNDIVAELRREFVRIDLERLAYRIEAAARRAECEANKRLLTLVRAHYGKDENAFLAESRSLAEHYDSVGDEELASFVRAQIGDEPSWVPMEGDSNE